MNTCRVCNGTGMRPGSTSLDCSACGAAEQRNALNLALAEIRMVAAENHELCNFDPVWIAYQMGKVAAQAESPRQPKIQSKHFIAQYTHDGGLVLDVYGHFDDSGDFMLEAIGPAGQDLDISNLISEQLDETITGWCEFMRQTWDAK